MSNGLKVESYTFQPKTISDSIIISRFSNTSYWSQDVAQTTGTSESTVMSQAAVSRAAMLNRNYSCVTSLNPRQKELDFMQCILSYEVYTSRCDRVRVMQTGISNNDGKFYMNLLMPGNIVINLKTTVESDRIGVSKIEITPASDLRAIIIIDWEQYNVLFASDMYRSASTVNYESIHLEIITQPIELNPSVDELIYNSEFVRTKYSNTTTYSEFYRDLFVILNKPFERSGTLKSLQFYMYYNPEDVSTRLHLYIGTLDHRNKLVNPRYYSYELSDLTSYVHSGPIGNVVISATMPDRIPIYEGEVLCIWSGRNVEGFGSWLIARRGEIIEDDPTTLSSTNVEGTFTETYTSSTIIADIHYYSTDLARQADVELLQNNLNTLNNTVLTSSIFTDLVTGIHYKLSVVNGVIVPKILEYQNALFIGSSFVTHNASASIGWYREGAMAPSLNSNSLPNLTLQQLKEKKLKC